MEEDLKIKIEKLDGSTSTTPATSGHTLHAAESGRSTRRGQRRDGNGRSELWCQCGEVKDLHRNSRREDCGQPAVHIAGVATDASGTWQRQPGHVTQKRVIFDIDRDRASTLQPREDCILLDVQSPVKSSQSPVGVSPSSPVPPSSPCIIGSPVGVRPRSSGNDEAIDSDSRLEWESALAEEVKALLQWEQSGSSQFWSDQRRCKKSSYPILLLYVDGMLTVGSDMRQIKMLKTCLSSSFEGEDLGAASQVLWIKIRRNWVSRDRASSQSPMFEEEQADPADEPYAADGRKPQHVWVLRSLRSRALHLGGERAEPLECAVADTAEDARDEAQEQIQFGELQLQLSLNPADMPIKHVPPDLGLH